MGGGLGGWRGSGFWVAGWLGSGFWVLAGWLVGWLAGMGYGNWFRHRHLFADTAYLGQVHIFTAMGARTGALVNKVGSFRNGTSKNTRPGSWKVILEFHLRMHTI